MMQKIEFSFGWLALKLLGKSLYSNAWSAISELVANGFDANAKNIYIYINMINKSKSLVEIIDDGVGLDENSIGIYAKVGYNKRLEQAPEVLENYKMMGRKGIGKLAALYLSERYFILSKTSAGVVNKWGMNYSENKEDENEKPFLRLINDTETKLRSNQIWEKIKTGTALILENVNLEGLGERALDSLENKLSNIFSLDSMMDRKIFIAIVKKDSEEPIFRPIEKKIAFKNMAFIDYFLKDSQQGLKETFDKLLKEDSKFKIESKKRDKEYLFDRKIELLDKNKVSGSGEFTDEQGIKKRKQYTLNGWIGIHSTIDNKIAKDNDANFTKNTFYNPIQLRLYVRNKLAVENFLNYLGNTQAFVNYIEGEIHFDLLDEDDLPDIATSNRQNLDEHDERVALLVDIVKSIISDLIIKREKLASDIKGEDNKNFDKRKNNFIKEVESELKERFPNESSEQVNEFTMIVANKVQGDMLKDKYKIFLSHSSHDKRFTDFLYFLLIEKCGVKKDEIFYTSAQDAGKFTVLEPLKDQIRSSITDDNVLLVYLASKNYKQSEYCMFEGGAGWATRGVGDYILMSLSYNEIPEFLTNGKLEFSFIKNNEIVLSKETYDFIINNVLNIIIEHLNKSRDENEKISLFDKPNFPTDIDMSNANKSVCDFMDRDVVEYWKYYIENGKKDGEIDIANFIKNRGK
jgi:molecular chaperone, HSP90 family